MKSFKDHHEDYVKKYFKKPKKNKYPADKLRQGKKVEKEHTNPKYKEEADKISSNIAKNHLDEMPDYYDKLKKMEKS